LLSIGFIGLCVHLYQNPEGMVEASTLGAMFATMLAARSFLSNNRGWVPIAVPLVIGAGISMLLYGFHQVYIQHPLTVELYESNKEAFLNARGWSDGSFEVLSYERRLNQPEPTGWFGLANVYASFLAAFGIAMVMMALCSLKKAWWLVSGLIAAAFLIMLVISKSKGAIGAAGLGFIVIQYALVRKEGRFSRVGTSTLGASILLMLGVFGGAMMGQLSLLFRGQYMVGALRIFEHHPIFGVGPGLFQDAYMKYKPSTSPEDVTSAHNLLFDLLAQLGISGIACVLLLILAVLSASIPGKDDTEQTSIPNRVRLRIIALISLVAGVVSIRLQSAAIDLEIMLVLLLGLGLWILTSVMLSALTSERTLRLSMLAGSVVLLLHALFDLTPVWIASAPLFGLCVGMGLSPDDTKPTSTKRFDYLKAPLAVSTFIAIVLVGHGAFNLIQRDQTLIELARPSQRIASIKASMSKNDPIQTVADELSLLTNIRVPADPRVISDTLRTVEIDQRVHAAQTLMQMHLTHDPTLKIAALEHTMKAAMSLDAIHQDGSDPLWCWVQEQAESIATQGGTFAELKWAGDALLSVAEVKPTQQNELRVKALDIWIQADGLNPHDPKHALRVMDLLVGLDRPLDAQKWAQEALDRSDRMKLDPLKQLNANSRTRAQALIDLN
jgi:hypothetical protein